MYNYFSIIENTKTSVEYIKLKEEFSYYFIFQRKVGSNVKSILVNQNIFAFKFIYDERHYYMATEIQNPHVPSIYIQLIAASSLPLP